MEGKVHQIWGLNPGSFKLTQVYHEVNIAIKIIATIFYGFILYNNIGHPLSPLTRMLQGIYYTFIINIRNLSLEEFL